MGDEGLKGAREEGSEVWGYAESPDPPQWSGACVTREEAIAEARKQLRVNACAPIFVVRGRIPKAVELLPDGASFLEHIRNRVQDQFGDAATEFPLVGSQGQCALEELLAAWVKKHVAAVRFWVAVSEPERIDPPPLALWNDGCYFVIAEDAERARALLIEKLGLGDDDTAPVDEWERWPADKAFTVFDEDEKRRDSLLPADWAKLYGPGYVGQTEM